MNLSVAVSSDWGIGFENDLLFRIPDDLKRFKKLTAGKVVVMGRNTFDSLPAGRAPLPNRTNIVLTRNPAWQRDGVIVCNSFENLNEILQNYDPQDIFIIGGEKIYSQMLNLCKRAYVTKVSAAPPADVFFPNIDSLPNWKSDRQFPEQFHDGLMFTYNIYVNTGV